jgi:hypothetical protein
MSNDELPEKNNLPKWPESLPLPDRIETTTMHIIEAEDLESNEEVDELISLMYAHKEREFYLFLKKGKPANRIILDRLEGFGIFRGASEFYYYRRPDSEHSYIRILSNEIQFDWQNRIVDEDPMFLRIALKLSQAKTRRLAIQEQLIIEKAQDVNPLELKPNFFGIGLDLFKFWRWALGWFRKRQWRGLDYKSRKNNNLRREMK